MNANMDGPTINITTKIDQENIGEGLFATALTGFIDIRQQFDVEGRRFLIEKILPFSLISVVEEPVNDCGKKSSQDIKAE